MKVLMINSVCGIKSTGRICVELASAMEKNNNEVKIGYGRDEVPDRYQKYAIRIGNKCDIRIHAIKARLHDADGLGSIYSTKVFLDWVEKYNPDVIHLHNLHGYYINVPMLFQYIIKNNKKVVWTLHDMWAFSGHSGTCDYHNCVKWETGCGNCPAYSEYPASFVDHSDMNYQWKKKLFSMVNDLTIVTPSKWLAKQVKRSFLGSKKIQVIPNGIDISQFKHIESDFKHYYKIENKTILMGCATAWSANKGLFDFYSLADRLDKKYKIVLVGLDKKQISSLPKDIIGIEKTNSVNELAQIYSAADLFVNLTYADNYPTVNIESLACGTPVITYDTGGSAECLNSNNGKKFEKGDIDSIVEFLNEQYSSELFVVGKSSEYDKSITCQKYIQAYLN